MLALEIAALTPIALVANLPTQFGMVGTDAASEFLGRGTAISAPLLPLLVLGALSGALLRARRGQVPLIAGLGLVGALFLVGALGEALAEPTAEVSRGVLLASGIGVGTMAVVMISLAIAALAKNAARPMPRLAKPTSH